MHSLPAHAAALHERARVTHAHINTHRVTTIQRTLVRIDALSHVPDLKHAPGREHADLKPTSAELPSYAGAVSESYGCAAGNACLTDKNSPVGEDHEVAYALSPSVRNGHDSTRLRAIAS